MANNFKLATNYFRGNEISLYGQEHGFLDYATFAKAFDAVLNNNIFQYGWEIGGGWELLNGSEYDEETEESREVYQWFIVSDNGAQMIQDYTDEILYYHEELDIYLWGVTHLGTSWEYVLTDIPCNCGYVDTMIKWQKAGGQNLQPFFLHPIFLKSRSPLIHYSTR